MACYRPVVAYQLAPEYFPFFDGKKWRENPSSLIFSKAVVQGKLHDELSVPCGYCIGCRVSRAMEWTIRATHELQTSDNVGCFLTLTYNDEHLKERCNNIGDNNFYGLNHQDFQLFMKRLRKFLGGKRVSYLMAGEYGSLNSRPHFHVLIFGYQFEDLELLKVTKAGFPVFRSANLEKLWRYGFSSVGGISVESINYVARYTTKKTFTPKPDTKITTYKPDGTSKNWRLHYDGAGGYAIPEYLKASVNPALGKTWLQKFWTDIYNHDTVKFKGRDLRPPRYYDKLLASWFSAEFELIKKRRNATMKERANDDEHSLARLAVKEQLALLRCAKFDRHIEEIKKVI